MPVHKHAKYFVGKPLSNRFHVLEVEHDFTELVQVQDQAPGFGTGYIFRLQQFHADFGFLKLEIIVRRCIRAEKLVERLPRITA